MPKDDSYDFTTPECHELAATYGVSLFTAARWIRKGKERSIARHLDRKAAAHLAEHRVCTAHGWDLSVMYKHKSKEHGSRDSV